MRLIYKEVIGILLLPFMTMAYDVSVVHAQLGGQTPTTIPPQQSDVARAYSQLVRQQLVMVQITDSDVQQSIITLSQTHREATSPVRADAYALAHIVGSKATPEEKIAQKLAALKSSAESEKRRRTSALNDFKAKVNLDQNPHLETQMMFFGLLGDESAVLNSVPVALEEIGFANVSEAIKVMFPDDEGLQKTVVKFVSEQEKALQPLLIQGKRWQVRQINTFDLDTDESRRAFLANYRLGVAQFKERREKALKKLDAKIGYSTKPRLEASLYVLGVISDDLGFLESFNTSGPIGFSRSDDVTTGQLLPILH